jgi:urease accessory protein
MDNLIRQPESKRQSYRVIPFGSIVIGLAALLLAPLAHAHVGFGGIAAGFARGFAHPLGGIDHIFAMVAVGLWSVQRGGRSIGLIPAIFVLLMALGGVIGTLGIFVPFVEQGIVLSVVVLGVLVAAAIQLPLFACAIVVGLFALFHGHAHGAEMPASASGLFYGAGFVLATAFLHALGMGIALLTRRLGQTNLVRLAGGALAMCGVYLSFAA